MTERGKGRADNVIERTWSALRQTEALAEQHESQDWAPSEISKELSRELSRVKTPSDFSENGLDALLTQQSRYIEDVGTYAIRAARKDRSEYVLARHVHDAADKVGSGSTETRALVLNSIGGAILGAGVGQLATVLSEPDISRVGVLFTISAIVLGLVMIFMGFNRRR